MVSPPMLKNYKLLVSNALVVGSRAQALRLIQATRLSNIRHVTLTVLRKVHAVLVGFVFVVVTETLVGTGTTLHVLSLSVRKKTVNVEQIAVRGAEDQLRVAGIATQDNAETIARNLQQLIAELIVSVSSLVALEVALIDVPAGSGC